jgi:hypothetical protein
MKSELATAAGPLRVSQDNPRYFSDSSGETVYLTGSHVWDNFQDWGGSTPTFDYDAYLKFLSDSNHNFFRLWRIGENTVKGGGIITPMPWERTGPGLAKDGAPRFDLTKLNEAYFMRMRSRIVAAGKKDIYVSIMLFDGIYQWPTHPFNPVNNINGIDGGDEAFFTFKDPEVIRIQKEYVRKVMDTVNDLDNVLYEVGNEIKRHSLEWQYHFIDYIHDYEKTQFKQHPVGMTSTGGNEPNDIRNSDLFKSPAEWISPRSSEPGQNYSYNPPPATGRKVIISDTDHLWGVLVNPGSPWVWKSFLRGINPIVMDVLQNKAPGFTDEWHPNPNGLKSSRIAMGQTLRYARRIDLKQMVPRGELCSTHYCLANPGYEYLIYQPSNAIGKRERVLQNIGILNRKIWVDLYGFSGTFHVEWYDPSSDKMMDGGTITAGGIEYFRVPFEEDAVLYLYR